MFQYLTIVILPVLISCQTWIQPQLDNFAKTLKVRWKVKDNLEFDYKVMVDVTLTNEGIYVLEKTGGWSIYFTCIMPIEFDNLPRPGEYVLEGQGLKLTHLQGSLFKLEPTPEFPDLLPGRSRKIKLKVQNWQVSRTDSMPNWYFAVPGLDAKVIQSTVGEDLEFVDNLDLPQQFKRYSFDTYSPYTAQARYRRNHPGTMTTDGQIRLIPKPLTTTVDNASSLTIDLQTWRIVAASDLSNEATYLNKMSSIEIAGQNADTNVIRMRTGNVPVPDGGRPNSPENYRLTVDPVNKVVEIVGQGAPGVFYGTQSLLSLMFQGNNMIYKLEITDSPRYEYRGLHIDVGRNFKTKDTILRLLGNIATYKLNRLHFHISEDEGWRLQIPGLEELTGVGSKRCHDLTETTCILPQIGSGPDETTSGSGFYTTDDYREILREANRLHIQVVPEFDMPGHSRAAIKSMEARYRRLLAAGQPEEARKYRLVEESDTSRYYTAQMFTDSNLNPCLASTYTFIEHVINEVMKMHEDIQPLRVYHYGADEIGNGAWVNSTQCKTLLNTQEMTLSLGKEYFFKRMANITANLNLNMAVWEDGLVKEGNVAFDRNLARNEEVFAYAWDNVWEWGTAQRPYSMANQGFKVVMTQATHLFFDHPYEPDPEERGYYWAPRFTDTMKTFGYTAENLYALIETRRSGQTITREEVCGEDNSKCPPLEKPENIAGIQGQLWSETMRTQDHVDSQLFPRLFALAERAWSKASWEGDIQTEAGMAAMKDDWRSFANLIGRHELRRLDAKGVKYRIPPPGAVIEKGFLKLTTTYPGLMVEYSKDDGKTWFRANHNVVVKPWDKIHLRTRSPDLSRHSRVISLYGVEPLPTVDQPTIDNIAESLDVKYKVLDNFQDGVSTYLAQITLKNKGKRAIGPGNWGIYLYNLFSLAEKQPHLDLEHVTMKHVNGGLFKLEPTPWFKPLEENEERKLKYFVIYWSVSRSDMMPNWYVWAEGMKAKTIKSTAGPELDFVEPFTDVKQYQRYNTTAFKDKYTPYSASMRYEMDKDIPDLKGKHNAIIPTPVTMVTDKSIEMLVSDLKVIYTEGMFQSDADFLKDKLSEAGFSVTVSTSAAQGQGYIRLFNRHPMVTINNQIASSPEAYSLTIDPLTKTVNIWSTGSHGIFNGIQSFLSLALKADRAFKLHKVTIEDAPRFEFRGMHLDTGRNFHTKETVLQLLDIMAMYKLNKFHFHLTEDEGWRVAIPGMEELTEIGGKRCHDLKEEKCLIPQWGSGPDTSTSGSGYYTVEDYREILRYASIRHIEVIPEVDSPGHGHAAIVAMKARRQRHLDIGDVENADTYRLHDLNDSSEYLSIQMFTDNSINPCVGSTFKFFRFVVDAFVDLHKDVNPLKKFHFGGDEVAAKAWLKSEACKPLLDAGVNLKEYFTQHISNITSARGLNMGGWEDGLMESVKKPFNLTKLTNSEVHANTWDNVWEWGVATRAYQLANEGYKVILSHATHLYFDHPYEPDPEERGFYWATRFASTWKTFGYIPDSVYDNVDVRRTGEVMTKEELCGSDGSLCLPLEKPENILGMQGHLWSETIRTPEHLHYMVFPRLIAMAERAWHKAEWENILDDKVKHNMYKREDWKNFTNTLGYQEFPYFDSRNISYRIPPPGARVISGRLKVISPIPNLPIETSTDGGKTWKTGNNNMKFNGGQTVWVALKSTDGKRRGRAVSVKIPGGFRPRPSRGEVNHLVTSLIALCLLVSVFS